MGITGPKLCTEKIDLGVDCAARMVMVVPKIEYLQALSMYCVSSMTINWRSQSDTRPSSGRSMATFMLASRSLRLATTSSISGATPTGVA